MQTPPNRTAASRVDQTLCAVYTCLIYTQYTLSIHSVYHNAASISKPKRPVRMPKSSRSFSALDISSLCDKRDVSDCVPQRPGEPQEVLGKSASDRLILADFDLCHSNRLHDSIRPLIIRTNRRFRECSAGELLIKSWIVKLAAQKPRNSE